MLSIFSSPLSFATDNKSTLADAQNVIASAKSMQGITVEKQTAWFAAFKQEFGKSYATVEEDAFRFSVFKDNLATATALNLDGEVGTHGVTKFSDLTPEEFKARYLGYKPKADAFAAQGTELNLPKTTFNATVDAVDWRGKGIL